MIVALEAELSFVVLGAGGTRARVMGIAGMEVNLKFAGRIKDGEEFPPPPPPLPLFPFQTGAPVNINSATKGIFSYSSQLYA